jgi:acyl-CoA thioesterase-1
LAALPLLLGAIALLAATSGCEREASGPAAGSVEPSPPRETTAAAPSLILLGDSLTAGFGLERSEALPALLQGRLDRAGLRYRVVDAGRSGDTTAGGVARLDWYFQASSNVAALVIALGSNDAMRGLPLADMEANLRIIVRRTRARFPEARVFLWELRTFPNLGPEYASRYAEVFPRVASEEGALLIPFPLEDVAARPELNQPDGIHPNREGAALVAERVWQSLRPHLSTTVVEGGG